MKKLTVLGGKKMRGMGRFGNEAKAPSALGAEDLPRTLARNEGTFLVSQGALASAKEDTH